MTEKKKASQYTSEGERQFRKGEYKHAAESFFSAIVVSSNHKAAFSGLEKLSKACSKKLKRDELDTISQKITHSFKNKEYTKVLSLLDQLILILPAVAELHNIRGASYFELAQFELSEKSYRLALTLNPKLQDTLYNYAILLRQLGRSEESIAHYQKLISLNPKYLEASFNLGVVLRETGKTWDSIKVYINALKLNPDYEMAVFGLIRSLNEIQRSDYVMSSLPLRQILIVLLSKDNVTHSELSEILHSCLPTKEMAKAVESGKFDISSELIKAITSDELLLLCLQKILVNSREFEKFITMSRMSICQYVSAGRVPELRIIEKFLISLSQQCFMNEYVFETSDTEKSIVDDVVAGLSSEDENLDIHLAVIGCYFSISAISIDLLDAAKKNGGALIEELINLQVIEPQIEDKLKKQIPKPSRVKDVTSKVVQSQYEENPYPRWRNASYVLESKLSVEQVVSNELSNGLIFPSSAAQRRKVLVAGCGTGSQVFNATRYADSVISAIDLSASSLAYSIRKTQEKKIGNVEHFQLDILDLDCLGNRYDVIESSGVLHHMSNPELGLETLTRNLVPGGFMKLGFYSELARRDIEIARRYIADLKLAPTIDSIRRFRAVVQKNEIPELESLLEIPDFYSTSMCRDLVFHFMEHRISIPRMKSMLEKSGLVFLGFILSDDTKSTYRKMFSEDKFLQDLSCWETFEKIYPQTFRGMYQFWCRKRE